MLSVLIQRVPETEIYRRTVVDANLHEDTRLGLLYLVVQSFVASSRGSVGQLVQLNSSRASRGDCSFVRAPR